MRTGKTTRLLALITTVLATPSVAFAQEQGADDETEAARGVGEIIVTAQKRAERLQDVPIAVSAFDEAKLTETGFDEISDLTQLVPGMQFGNFGPVAFVALRGISYENTTAAGDPGVALHLDGVYIGRPVATLFSAFDTERTEVLRGPQGTLYGRNATGGSVNVITKKPSDEFEGSYEQTVGNYDWFRERAMINVPLGDTVRARITGFKDDRQGFTRNTFAGGTRANGIDNWGLRGHLEIDLADNFDILLSANYVNVGGSGSQPEVREPFPAAGTSIPGFGAGAFGNNVNDLRPFIESKNVRELVDNDLLLLSGTMTWDFESFSIKSVTAYGESSFFSRQDSDSSPVNIVELNLVEDASQFSQELQVVSTDGGNFEWIVGLYYFNEDAFRSSRFLGPQFDATVAMFPNLKFGVDLGGTVSTESYAAFGQFTWRFTDTLSLTAGGRVTHDSRNGINDITLRAVNPNFPPVIVMLPSSISSTEPTGRVTLDWKAADDVLVYATAARGYKSGGINQQSASPNRTFEPEFVDSYEMGIKSQLFDRTLQVNLAGFYNEYNDLQFQVFGFAGPEAANAGQAHAYGFEAEWVAAPSDFVTIDGSFSYLSTAYDDLLFSVNGTTAVDLSGNELSRAPEFTFALGATVGGQLGGGKGDLKLRSDVSYQDSAFFTPFNRPADRTSSYTNVNLRLLWTSEEETFNAQLFVTNLFDTVQEGNLLRGVGFVDEPGGGGQEFVTYRAPRQYGLTVGFKF